MLTEHTLASSSLLFNGGSARAAFKASRFLPLDVNLLTSDSLFNMSINNNFNMTKPHLLAIASESSSCPPSGSS